MQKIIVLISVLGMIQGLFFSFQILYVKDRYFKANIYLSLLVFFLVFYMGSGLGSWDLRIDPKDLGNTPNMLVLTFGPLLHLYIYKFLFVDAKLHHLDFLHFLPLAIMFFDKIVFQNLSELDGLAVVMTLHLTGYILLSFKWIIRYAKSSSVYGNTTAKLKVLWTKNLSLISVVILSIYFGFYLTGSNAIHIAIPIMITATIYFLGFMGFLYPELYRITSESKTKYASSSLSPIRKESGAKKLLELMTREKIYKDFNLNLENLSRKMNLTKHQLSQIINENFDKNFSDFINSFRIEEAKKLLENPQYNNLKILAIAHEVGFRSKSAFYTSFKKFTSKTPSTFLSS